MIEIFTVTSFQSGAWICANNIRQAKKIFRKHHPHEKIMYSKLIGQLKK